MLREHQIAIIEVISANLKCNHQPLSSSFLPLLLPACSFPSPDVCDNHSSSLSSQPLTHFQGLSLALSLSLSLSRSHALFLPVSWCLSSSLSLLLPFSFPLPVSSLHPHKPLCTFSSLSAIHPALCFHYQISSFYCHILSMSSIITSICSCWSFLFYWLYFLLCIKHRGFIAP